MNVVSKNRTTTDFENDATQLLESAIASNLSMTPEERIEAHENALNLALDLETAGEALRAKSEKSPQNTA